MTRLQKLSHIAEIIAATGIVISLLYVGFQVNENTTAIRNGNQQDLMALGHDWDGWLSNLQFAEVLAKGNSNLSSLTEAERLQYNQYLTIGLNIWEYAYYSHQDGLLTDEMWNAWNGFFRQKYANPSWFQVWESMQFAYGEDFRLHVNLSE